MSDPSGAPAARDAGRIERTLAGGGELDIRRVCVEAWGRTAGTKAVVVGGYVLINLIVWLFVAVMEGAGVSLKAPRLDSLIAQIALTALVYPLFVGVFLVAVRRACGVPIAFGHLAQHYEQTGRLVVTSLLSSVLTGLGLMLLILPGIYLAIAYTFALPLLVDHRLSVWEALETSRQVVTRHWFTMFVLLALLGVVLAISIMLFLVPLIWTLPWSTLVVAIAYRQLVGPGEVIAAEAAAADDGLFLP